MAEIITGSTVAAVWLDAYKKIYSLNSGNCFSMILEVTNPSLVTLNDRQLLNKVDEFLFSENLNPLSTVANTIFPLGLYRRYGKAGMYERYLDIYPVIKLCRANKWGTYFHRMLHREKSNGEIINPLNILIEKISASAARTSPKKSAYELNIVDPFLDIPIADPTLPGITYDLAGPCLSHLSFKIMNRDTLGLTVFYRSHYYVEKTLGNLIGLSQLMQFVARETGLDVGPLVCISSYAVVNHAFGKAKLSKLLHDCETCLEPSLSIVDSRQAINVSDAA